MISEVFYFQRITSINSSSKIYSNKPNLRTRLNETRAKPLAFSHPLPYSTFMLELKLHPNPKQNIYSRISNPVRKAAYLFALCATHPLYSKHKELLGGVLDMLDGLKHNIKKIRTYEKAACRFAADLNALRKTKEPFTLSKRTNVNNVLILTHFF